MKSYRWTAAALAALLAVSAMPVHSFAEEYYAEEAAEPTEQQMTEITGELKISGWAAVDTELTANLAEIEAGVSEDDLWFTWFRTDDDGNHIDLSTESRYTPKDSDLGARINLWISGNPDRGFSGGLAAVSYPVQATETEAIRYAADQGDEEAIALLASMEPVTETNYYTETDNYSDSNGFADAGTYSYPENGYVQDDQNAWTAGADTGAAAAGGTEVQVSEEEFYVGEESSGTETSSEEDTSWIEQSAEEVFMVDENGQMTLQDPAQQETQPEVQPETQPAVQNNGEGQIEEPGTVGESAPTYAAEALTNDGSGVLDFGTFRENEAAEAEAQYVTIRNTGTGILHFNEISPEHFMVEDIYTPLAPEEDVTVWVIPRDGSPAGEYEDKITYSTEEGTEISFTAKMTVQAVEETEEEDGTAPTDGDDGDFLVDIDENGIASIQVTAEDAVQPVSDISDETTPEPSPTAEPTATPEPAPTEEPTPEPSPTAEPTATPEPTPTEEPTPEPSPTAEPTATPEPTPTEAPTPEPTATPEPTPTEAPVISVLCDPQSIAFDTVTEGYTTPPAAVTITLTNNGNVPVNIAQPSAENYVTGALQQSTLQPGQTTTFTVHPAENLPAGDYNETISVLSADDGSVLTALGVTFYVEKEERITSLSASPASLNFGVVQAGYSQAPQAQTVTVSNTGNTTLTLQQPSAANYVIGALSSAVVAPGESASFTVQPASGLAEGSYSASIRVTGAEGGEATVAVSFNVATRTIVLTGVQAPADITGVKNGSPKTAQGLGLPATVVIHTSNGDMNANVAWDVNGCDYDPSSKAAQTFTVKGTVTLPGGIENPDNISLITAVKVSVSGRTPIVPDPAANQISGITSGQQYTTETKISFTAVGAGMDNQSPIEGDVRYVPQKWHLVDDRTWENPPYAATFRIAKPGTYKVTVTFKQQRYEGSKWADTGVYDTKETSFTVNGTAIVTATPTPTPEAWHAAQTGDDTNIAPFVIVLIIAAAAIAGAAAFLLIRKKNK